MWHCNPDKKGQRYIFHTSVQLAILKSQDKNKKCFTNTKQIQTHKYGRSPDSCNTRLVFLASTARRPSLSRPPRLFVCDGGDCVSFSRLSTSPMPVDCLTPAVVAWRENYSGHLWHNGGTIAKFHKSLVKLFSFFLEKWDILFILKTLIPQVHWNIFT